MNDQPPVSMPAVDLLVPLFISFEERWPPAEIALGHDHRQVSVDRMLVEITGYNRARDRLLRDLLQLAVEVITDPTQDPRPRIDVLAARIERDISTVGQALLEGRGDSVS